MGSWYVGTCHVGAWFMSAWQLVLVDRCGCLEYGYFILHVGAYL